MCNRLGKKKKTQNRLRKADAQSQELTDQMHRMDIEKKELSSRFGVLYSTLKRFIRVLDDGDPRHQNHQSSTNASRAQEAGGRFLQPLSSTLGTSFKNNSPYFALVIICSSLKQIRKCP